METVIIRDIQTKQKVGCKYCGRYSEPPKHEIVEEDNTMYYSCDTHLRIHILSIRGGA